MSPVFLVPVAPGTQKNLGFAPAEALVGTPAQLVASHRAHLVDDFKNTIHI